MSKLPASERPPAHPSSGFSAEPTLLLPKCIVGDEKTEKTVRTIIPLVSIESIIDRFNAFKEMPENQSNKESFQCEQQKGPPPAYMFVFPNKESMDKFIDLLVKNREISLPTQEQTVDLANSPRRP